jgi:hypothetical protein
LVELKKAAIALQTDLWLRLGKCEIYNQYGQLPQGCIVGVENPTYTEDQEGFASQKDQVSLAMSCFESEADTDGLLRHVQLAAHLSEMAQQMAPVKKALIAADLASLKSDLVRIEQSVEETLSVPAASKVIKDSPCAQYELLRALLKRNNKTYDVASASLS